ncbi:Serine/threonine protein kinase [Giardia duodenalis assemblage B]|uniref:Serine/threonine protein kinase n=1 Tax=Giardia duodenalis assemblage B TaxID=1394984 RepID=A0A132NMA3_GIAIN|nr:Serine/threonine protein kinase [Giardia intestinalis assemblage B]
MQRPLQREAGEDCREEMHPGTAATARHESAAQRGQHGAGGTRTCVSSGSPAAPSRSARGTAGCTRSTRGAHRTRRTAERGTDGPQHRAPPLNQRAPRPGTVRPVFLRADTPSCARTAASAHRKGARTPRHLPERPDPFSDHRLPARQRAPREEEPMHTR